MRFKIGPRLQGASHVGAVNDLALERQEERYLISVSSDASMMINDLFATREAPITKSNLHKFAITRVCWFATDTGLFTTSSLDKTVKVWDTNKLQELCCFKIGSPVQSHDLGVGSLIACASSDPRIRLCDLRTGGCAQNLVGHQDVVTCVKWNQKEVFQLASAAMDGVVKVFDIRKGGGHSQQCLFTLQVPLAHQPNIQVGINGLKNAQDTDCIFISSLNSSVSQWNFRTGQQAAVTYGPVQNAYVSSKQFDAVDNCVLYPNDDGSLLCFDLTTGAQLSQLQGGHYGRVNCCTATQLSKECINLYSGGNDGRIFEWVPTNNIASDPEMDYWLEQDPGDTWSDD